MCAECARRTAEPNCPATRALGLVLAIALDRETVAACLAGDGDDSVTLWPSTLYATLAVSALRSPIVWRRCEVAIDAALARHGTSFESYSPNELADLFVAGRELCSGMELAALLWALLKSDAAPGISDRIGAELELLAARRLSASDRPHSIRLLA